MLRADKIHVATWGQMDHVHETMKMTLAIPGKSLRDFVGLTMITPDYHLQVVSCKLSSLTTVLD